jgi:hypothetical protein
VLYELFTGKRPYEAKTVQQLIDLQESATLASMTSIAADVDPAVEKVIRRCLDPDAARRPATALSVSAALPGGDPLAAALAAGETPSPELVAASGKVEGLARKYSIPCLAVIAASLMLAPWFFARNRAAMRAPLESSPDVLAHQAREIAATFGYAARPGDSTIWLEHRPDVVRHLLERSGPKAWDRWLASEAPLVAIYRESPEPMVAIPSGRISRQNPPLLLPGMATVTVDGHGRLLNFSAVPRHSDPPVPATPEAVFRAARLDMTAFHEVPATLVPDHASDTIREWEGPHPVLPDTTLTLQAAFWRGQVTQVQVVYPWMKGESGGGPASSGWGKAREILVFTLAIVGTLVAALVARRNWKLGRTDRKGALRVAGARIVLGLVVTAGAAHAVASGELLNILIGAAEELLLPAGILWLVYLAIEPSVRARFPHSVITWNRLLTGRWWDAQVAGDVLIGGAVGCVLWTAAAVMDSGGTDYVATGGNVFSVLGVRQMVARFAAVASDSLNYGLLVFAVICLARRLVRYDAVAALVTAIVFTLAEGDVARSNNVMTTVALFIAVYGILAFVLIRIGLVATIAAIFFINVFPAIWLGGDFTAWYAPYGIAAILISFSIALIAFWKSLGSRGLLGGEA